MVALLPLFALPGELPPLDEKEEEDINGTSAEPLDEDCLKDDDDDKDEKVDT